MSSKTTTTSIAAARRNPRSRPGVVRTTKTVTTQPKKRTKKKNQSKPRPMPVIMPPIAKCTEDYAICLVDPFQAKETLPCIPDNIVLPSHKFQTKCRGVFSTGTAGTGFCIFDPFAMAWNDPVNGASTSSFPIVYSTPNNPAGTLNYQPGVAGNFPTGTTGAASNSPYPRAFFNDAAHQLRLVAAGLRIRFTGSTFRNQGYVTIARSQGNISLPGASTSASLLQDNYNVMIPISRKSEYTFFVPDNATFYSYVPGNNYIGSAGGISHYSLLAWIEGADITVPQSFIFEAVAYFEMTGPFLTLSPSHSDIQNLGHVMEALPTQNPTGTPMETVRSVLGNITNSLYSLYMANSGRINQAVLSYAMGRVNGAIPQARISYDTPD